MPGPGRFISIEGGEGVGKSLFTSSLATRLKREGREVVTTREPGGTPVADQIRAVFSAPAGGERLTMEAEALLVSAARAQHVAHVIRPALARGAWVLCDRYADSTRVYQGALGDLGVADVEALIRFSTGGLTPDLTFLLDCDVALARERLARRPGDAAGQVARYDQAQGVFHQRLREAYLELARRGAGRFRVIAADLPADALVAAAVRALEERFGDA
jgi:dTMP kinase